jgi:hypothetical protein
MNKDEFMNVMQATLLLFDDTKVEELSKSFSPIEIAIAQYMTNFCKKYQIKKEVQNVQIQTTSPRKFSFDD